MTRRLLAALLLSGCATIQEPPGGPPDFAPPVLLDVTPDSGSVLQRLDQPLIIRFNEVIREQQNMEELVVVSPRPREVSVSWRRDELAVKPSEGWHDSLPYRVTLLPGITDLRNNRLQEGRTVVFSTGGPIPDTRVTGRVVDWEAGTIGARAVVEVIRPSDSLTFWGLADSTGVFTIPAVPRGDYILMATLDRNNNRRRDPREPFDSSLVRLDSAVTDTLWAFVHDTTGPRLRQATRVDSTLVRLEFTQPLAPGPVNATAVSVRALPDSVPVSVSAVLSQQEVDSLRAQARPDTAGAAPDTARARPPVAPQAPRAVTPGRGATAQPRAVMDSTAMQLVRQRPQLSPIRFLQVAQPLAPGGRYVIDARVTNPSGATGESATVLVVPEAVPVPVQAPGAPPAPADSVPG